MDTLPPQSNSLFFFFNDTATTEIYTLSLHDALPISPWAMTIAKAINAQIMDTTTAGARRSEEHTSELQSRLHLVCRLLLEKKKTKYKPTIHNICRCHVEHV